MRIVIAGGHGKIALLLEHILAERGDQAVGLIRNPAHVADVRRAGAEAAARPRARPCSSPPGLSTRSATPAGARPANSSPARPAPSP